MSGIEFTAVATSGHARRGRITTAHGTIETPVFMPVGTVGSIKGMLASHVADTGATIILANTYHLMLRPGADLVASMGGLHRFMSWPGPILTDSGGYQVMSLAGLRRLDESGVTFRSHLDGRSCALSPETAMTIQHQLDSTITMCLDECVSWPTSRDNAARAMELSLRWAARCRAAFSQRPGYGLFGIVQGSTYPDLRQVSAEGLAGISFDGYAIGGLAVGEPQDIMFETLEQCIPHLPAARPRYLMGVGKPDDIAGAVLRGVDMFDCVLPTRSGRTAQLFTIDGPLNIRNARHATDPGPIEQDCPCPACRSHSRGYLHHLFKSGEMLGPILATWHNLQHYQDLMRALRDAIPAGEIERVAMERIHRWREGGGRKLSPSAATDSEFEDRG